MMITMTRNPHLITLQILRFQIDVCVYIIPFDGIMEMPFWFFSRLAGNYHANLNLR